MSKRWCKFGRPTRLQCVVNGDMKNQQNTRILGFRATVKIGVEVKEFATKNRIRLLSIAEQKQREEAERLNKVKSIASDIKLHEEQRDQLREEDEQNWHKSIDKSAQDKKSIYVKLVNLMKEIDEIQGEAHLEQMELCGNLTGKYYKKAARDHFKWMKKRAKILKREEAERQRKELEQ